MAMVRGLRFVAVGALFVALLGAGLARADKAVKPPKVPVFFGQWTGPSASTFKSALRRGLAKDCVVVAKKKARVVLEGTVEEQGKGALVHVRVKAAKTDELVQTKDFPFARIKVSSAQATAMGKKIADIARQSPDPDAPAAP